MGQAKKRGTFDERKKAAIEKSLGWKSQHLIEDELISKTQSQIEPLRRPKKIDIGGVRLMLSPIGVNPEMIRMFEEHEKK